MKWAHLPVAGGLYDQHPQLIDEWDILFEMDAHYQLQRQRQQEAEMKNRR